MNEVVGFISSSALLLLVMAFYLGGTGFLLFLLDKLAPAEKQR